MSLFSLTKKDQYSLAFIIGSGSVAGAIIKFTEQPGVEVLYYAKESLPIQKEISAPKHLESMSAVLSDLTEKIHKNKANFVRIRNAFYIFSSPWSLSETKTFRIKESKAFKVTADYLKNISAGQAKLSTETTIQGKVIENKIIQLKINGYIVDEPRGQLAKEVEVSTFSTVIPETILQAVEKAVSRSFVVKNTWCHSLSLPMFSTIRDLYSNQEDFIYLDVSEEMTDVSVVKNGLVVSGVSFPFGRNHFIRGLATRLGVTEALADSMLTMHCAKNNDELAAIKVGVAMDTVTGDWSKHLTEIFGGLIEKLFVPQTIFILAGKDLTPFLSAKLQKENLSVKTIEAKKIHSTIKVDDPIFKIGLAFLDKVYKI